MHRICPLQSLQVLPTILSFVSVLTPSHFTKLCVLHQFQLEFWNFSRWQLSAPAHLHTLLYSESYISKWSTLVPVWFGLFLLHLQWSWWTYTFSALPLLEFRLCFLWLIIYFIKITSSLLECRLTMPVFSLALLREMLNVERLYFIISVNLYFCLLWTC